MPDQLLCVSVGWPVHKQGAQLYAKAGLLYYKLVDSFIYRVLQLAKFSVEPVL